MRILKTWALVTFVLTFIVILAGGIVRTTQSGMGCPDWPTCFGRWIPPTNAEQLPPDFEKYLGKQDIDHSFNAFHTWIEYINRLVGVLLGLFAIIQLLLAFRVRKINRKMFRWSIVYLVLVILTGLFGAIVVKLNLAHATVTVHLFFAIILLLAELALLMQAYNRTGTISAKDSFRYLQYALLLSIIIQIVLGTGVRIYIDDISSEFDYEQREDWLSSLPIIFIIHRTFSWLVVGLSLFNYIHTRNVSNLKLKTGFLLFIILLSVITGVTLYYLNMPAIAQPIHLLLACFAICQSVFIIFSFQTRSLTKTPLPIT